MVWCLPVGYGCSSFNPVCVSRVPLWTRVISHPWRLNVGETCLPTELRSWWGRWVILAFEGAEEAFSCFAHYGCTEAWHPTSSCLVEIMVRWTSNRTSAWKPAWLKTKLPEGERCGNKVLLMHMTCYWCILRVLKLHKSLETEYYWGSTTGPTPMKHSAQA